MHKQYRNSDKTDYQDMRASLVRFALEGSTHRPPLARDPDGNWFCSVSASSTALGCAPQTARRALWAWCDDNRPHHPQLGLPVHPTDLGKSCVRAGTTLPTLAAAVPKQTRPTNWTAAREQAEAIMRLAVERLLAGDSTPLALDLSRRLRWRSSELDGVGAIKAGHAVRSLDMWDLDAPREHAPFRARVGRRMDLRKFLTWCTHTDGIDAQAVVTALLARPRVDAQPNPVGRPRTRDVTASERDQYWAEVHEREQARDQGWGQ